jgi:hypothetical protein
VSRFFGKILPEARGWRFFQKPAGLDLDEPGRGIIFFIGLIYFVAPLFIILGTVECYCENEYFFGGWAWLELLLQALQVLRDEALAFVPPFQFWGEGSKDSANE